MSDSVAMEIVMANGECPKCHNGSWIEYNGGRASGVVYWCDSCKETFERVGRATGGVIPSAKHQWVWTADEEVRKSAPIPPEMQLTRADVLEFSNEAQIDPDVARAFPHLAEQCERHIERVIAHHDRWVRNYGIRLYIKHNGTWYAR